jgi:hypothetical protein
MSPRDAEKLRKLAQFSDQEFFWTELGNFPNGPCSVLPAFLRSLHKWTPPLFILFANSAWQPRG